MSSIANRRLARRDGAGAQPQPLDAAKLKRGNAGRDKKVHHGRKENSNSDSDSEDEVEELDTPSPKSPDSPFSTTTKTAPTVTIPITTLPPANTPPTITTEPLVTTTTAALPPPPPPPPPPVVITTVATTTTPPAPPPPPPPSTTSPGITLLPSKTDIKNPARESEIAPSEPLPTSTASPSPSPPPTSETTTTSSPTTSTRTPNATTSPTATSTTQLTTRFVLSSTGFTNGVATTLLITLPNGASPPPTTLSTRTSTNTKTSTSSTSIITSITSIATTSSKASGAKSSTTTSLSTTPIESAEPVLQPSYTDDPFPDFTSEPEQDHLKAHNQAPTLTTGGVAALSIVIALASIASIAFLVWKCCWPRRKRNLPPPTASTPFQHLKFWDRPSPAGSRGMGMGSESGTLPPPGAPQMAYIRPEDMDQVMAAAYEAEQGNAGVYGRYADQRQRGSWHTDDSSILEEKQRQYEAAVAASAINGTAPPDPRRSRAMQLGQMMNSFLQKRHDNPGYTGSDGGGGSVGTAPGGLAVPERSLAPGVRPPDTPTGTTTGPTAFMPKNNFVEWSWRISVGRRASKEAPAKGDNVGEGWMTKASRFAGLKA